MAKPGHGVRLGAAIAAVACAVTIATFILLSGCGDSDRVVGGSAHVAMVTPPDYLDPQLAYTTEAAEADWIAYTPLLTYRHKSGSDGAELIPGLALRMPQISRDGRSTGWPSGRASSIPMAGRSWRATSSTRSSARSGWAGRASGS